MTSASVVTVVISSQHGRWSIRFSERVLVRIGFVTLAAGVVIALGPAARMMMNDDDDADPARGVGGAIQPTAGCHVTTVDPVARALFADW